jgi:hypothetical protein
MINQSLLQNYDLPESVGISDVLIRITFLVSISFQGAVDWIEIVLVVTGKWAFPLGDNLCYLLARFTDIVGNIVLKTHT